MSLLIRRLTGVTQPAGNLGDEDEMPRKVWTNRDGFDITPAVRKRVLKALRDACQWCAENQVRHEWPNWDNNHGRLPGAVSTRNGKIGWSISWNVARTAQGLLAASKVLGKDVTAFEETAELGLYHDTRLQIYDPEYPQLRGAIREETVNCFHINPRDGIECSQGWIAKTLYDGRKADPIWLSRACDHLNWTVNFLMQQPAWPMEYVFFGRDYAKDMPPVPRPYSDDRLRMRNPNHPIAFCFAGLPIPICQYVSLTGEKKLVRKGAVPMADWLLDTFFDAGTGALRLPEGSVGHHSDMIGGLQRAIGNDDGAMIALLCLHRLDPKRKWLDPVIANADWWSGITSRLHLFSAVPAAMLLMLDTARLTGKREYLDWVLARLDEVLALQCQKPDPRMHGGFMGEDIERMSTWLGCAQARRSACGWSSYLLIGLSKLVANAKTWSPAYSCFGW